jgi:hypothetical protein
VEEMLGERVVGHVLGHEQPLVTLGAASNEVDEALVPHLPHPRRLRLQQNIGRSGRGWNQREQAIDQSNEGAYEELLRVGPGEAREALDGD